MPPARGRLFSGVFWGGHVAGFPQRRGVPVGGRPVLAGPVALFHHPQTASSVSGEYRGAEPWGAAESILSDPADATERPQPWSTVHVL